MLTVLNMVLTSFIVSTPKYLGNIMISAQCISSHIYTVLKIFLTPWVNLVVEIITSFKWPNPLQSFEMCRGSNTSETLNHWIAKQPRSQATTNYSVVFKT